MAAPFISLQGPPGQGVLNYKFGQPDNDAADVPQIFKDAIEVRTDVFVREQGVPAENEIDDDDPKSWHWVVYASVAAHGRDADGKRSSQTASVPVGTIRLVPPPHAAHPAHAGDEHAKDDAEPYIKLGRIATLQPYRGIGLSKLLAKAALDWAAEHPEEILPPIPAAQREAHGREQKWNGLVMVHAQKAVEKFWAKFGFVTDPSLGEWDEEGIMHVGMYKRLTVAEAKHG